MSEILKTVLIMSAAGGAAGALLLGIKPITRRVFGPTWQYYIWLVPLIIMCIPPFVEFSAPAAQYDAPSREYRLLAQDAAQILAHLIVILRVLDVLEDILQLAVDPQVRAAVLGALQSTDGRRDGRVGVRTGGGQHAGGKGGAVAAAVVCVNQQAQIQQACFLVGELLVCTV